MSTRVPEASAPDADARSTRDRILDAAEEVFAEKGLAAAPVRDIAARVGLNAGSLYNHFRGKEELYEAVLERGLTPVLETVTEQLLAAGTPGRDEETLDRIVTHFATNPHLARLIQYEVLAGGGRIAGLAARFFGPLYERGVEALRASRAGGQWPEHELPLLLFGFQNLVVGYFAMAPFAGLLLGEDPFSEPALQRQKQFLHKVARLLMPLPPG